jgi:hypothetical protein
MGCRIVALMTHQEGMIGIMMQAEEEEKDWDANEHSTSPNLQLAGVQVVDVGFVPAYPFPTGVCAVLAVWWRFL